MGEGTSDGSGLRPNRFVLALIVALASFIGLLPYWCFIDRLDSLAALFVAIAAAGGFASLKGAPTEATERPSLGEWLLGLWSAVAMPAIAGLLGMAFYGIAYGGTRLWNAATGAVEFGAPGDPAAVAFWVSLVMEGLFVASAAAASAEKLQRGLYPGTAGERSVYFQFLGQPLKLASMAAAIVGAFAVLLVFSDSGSIWPPIGAAFLLFFASMPFDQLAEERAGPLEVGAVDAVAKIFEGAGYSVTRSPRTGNPEVDPLIRNVVLLARHGREAFAINVKDPRAAKTVVEWNAASAVRTAAAVLQQEIAASGGKGCAVRPLLVVVGGELAPSLQRFSEQESVPVVHLRGELLDRAQAGVADGQKRLIEFFRRAGVPFPAQRADSGTGLP